jgi:undecaprenyl-diphosphatase
MIIIQSILLGIIQGLTEFIPVSSTAHLLIAQRLIGWQNPTPQQSSFIFIFIVLVQLGTVLALIIYFKKELYQIIRITLTSLWNKKPFAEPQARLGWFLILATIPAGIGGILFKPLVEQLFKNPLLEAFIRLSMTAVLLLIAEKIGQHNRELDSLNWKDALWIGCAQVLSIFPGVSRSGTTIAGGMTRQFVRPAAARFSFLMSIPVMLLAGLYEMRDVFNIQGMISYLPAILAGFITAAIVGYLSIRWLLTFLARSPLYIFIIYCATLSLLILIAMVI